MSTTILESGIPRNLEQKDPRPTTSTKPALGRLRYVPVGHVPKPSPHNYHLPAISEFGDVRILPLHSMRPVPTVDELPSAKNHAQLSTHGFTAVHHPTTLHKAPYTLSSWKDPSLLKKYYILDTVDMLKKITGCKTVTTEALLLRSALWTESDALATHAGHGKDRSSAASPTPNHPDDDQTLKHSIQDLETSFPSFIGFNPTAGGVSPAPKPHLDYSPAGARTHIRRYHPDLTAAAQEIITAEDNPTTDGTDTPRWAMYSIWRPLKPVRRDPLALLDQRTMTEGDYIPVNIKTPCLGRGTGVEGMETHDAEGYLAHYREGHIWYWIEEQMPEEVLIIGLFDSQMEGRGWRGAGGTLHSSVELVRGDGEEDLEARESLELRCLCIW